MSDRGGFTADRRDLKHDAVEFYRSNRVPQHFERALNELYARKPADVCGYLADYFRGLSLAPRISRLNGRHVYDARGQICIQAQVFCTVCNREKRTSSAAVSGHFLSSQEVDDHVTVAAQWINGPINDMLIGQNPCDQSDIDNTLSNFFMARCLEDADFRNKDKDSSCELEVTAEPSPVPKRLEKGKKSGPPDKPLPPAESPESVLSGSSAVSSVSLAVAKTGAKIHEIPLYRHIAALKETETAVKRFQVPVPLLTLLSCGKSSPGKLNLLEEIIIIPKAGQPVKQIITMTLELQKETMRIMNAATKPGAPVPLFHRGAPTAAFERFEQPLDVIQEACTNSGLDLGSQIHLALNCAGPDLMDYGKYEVSTGVFKSPDELVDMYQTLVNKYPAVVTLIDPFRREDVDQWEKLNAAVGDSCSLLSDVTYRPKAPPPPGVKGHVLKYANETTVSDLVRITSENKGSVILGSTLNEPSSDDSLSDLAVGLGLDYVKLGGLSGAERTTKYNRLISIEEELEQQGILVSQEKNSPPLFPIDEPHD